MNRRIVITGMGAATPVGIGPEETWQALRAGTSGVGPITRFEVGDFPIRTVAEVKEFKSRNYIPERKAIKVMSWDLQLSVAAACMAVADAGIITPEKRVASERLGCSFGAGLINTDLDEFAHATVPSADAEGRCLLGKFGSEVMKNLFPLWLLKYLPNMPGAHVSIFYDAQGPTNAITTGDTASIEAVGEACRVIERGAADVMICGAADAKINPLSMARYQLSGAAADGGDAVARPFDRDRRGFVVGEGGAGLVIEEYEHAKSRGAKLLGEIVGFGAGCDAYDEAPFHPAGRGSRVAMKNALKDAGIAPGDVQLLFASANGSRDLDRAEASAINAVFGTDVAVTSTRGALGYISVANGIIDAVAGALALRDGTICPTLHCENVDESCPVNVVAGEARPSPLSHVLINTVGFGGQCAALVLKKVAD